MWHACGMNFDSGRRPYFPPVATELTAEQAKVHLEEFSHGNDREAADFLRSTRQEQRKNTEKCAPNWDADESWERSA
jgi:hypothetical protein